MALPFAHPLLVKLQTRQRHVESLTATHVRLPLTRQSGRWRIVGYAKKVDICRNRLVRQKS